MVFANVFVVEEDWLIRWDVSAFAGAATKETPKLDCASSRSPFLELILPRLTSIRLNGLVDAGVKFSNCRVKRVDFSKSVALRL